MGSVIARQRLFLNADKTKLVAEGDTEGAFLYVAPGDEIPEDAHEKFGLKDGALPGFKEAAGDDDGEKVPNIAPPPGPKEKAARRQAKAQTGAQAKPGAQAKQDRSASTTKEAKPGQDKEAGAGADKSDGKPADGAGGEGAGEGAGEGKGQ